MTAASWSRLFRSGGACRGARRSAPAPSPGTSTALPSSAAVGRAGARTPPRRAGCRRRARGARCVSAGRTVARAARRPGGRSPRPERGKVDRAVAFREPAAQTRMLLVQLGTGGAEQEERHTFRPVRHVLEEREEGRVGPVQILEDEHRRPPVGERLQEAPPGGERLLLRCGLGPTPTSGARRALSQAGRDRPPGSARSSFASASSGESVSRMPHSALTISPSAQKAMPSP